jgi:hypothetical protein
MKGSGLGLTHNYYPAICLEGLMKTTKNFSKKVDVAANIRTGHLQDKNQRRYRFSQVAR